MRLLNSRNEERNYYIEGNTARKLSTAPQRVYRPEQEERRANQRVSRNSKRARAFNLKYTVALIVATTFLFVACINMLTLQANITEQRREISVLQSDLNNLKNTNDETNKRLDSSIDLTKVYDVAVNELGMVYPKQGQIISYKASNPDYVKQFADIPVE